ncbi:hypothetical protein SAMN05216241_11329 [Limimonas halophila]|uniref:DUF2764 family protein n=1 Tax=Limimonas halophila TaxID=1082479 RepID=A0A1G7UAR3_9PROT|nr:hypothetical protein [Limimonas halophila]SDG44685.1 hypothetical protein SAMN05216241_11329 [Limimonas halophila]
MPAATRYVDLISSLPHLGTPFTARERPITRRQLDRRLRLLEPGDAATLQEAEGVLRWAVLQGGADDRTQGARARRVAETIADSTLREAVRRRLESRALVAALRRRRDGLGPPDDPAMLGYHRAADRIRRHWDDPAFGLRHSAAWVLDADEHLQAGDSLALEKLLLTRAWRDLDALAQGHWFDFAAVALYVLRWDLMDRWMRYDGEAAAQRFEALVDRALAAHGPVLQTEEA